MKADDPDQRVPRFNRSEVNRAGQTQASQNHLPLHSQKRSWAFLGAGIIVALATGLAIGFIGGHQTGKNSDARERIEAQARAAAGATQNQTLKDQLIDTIAQREKEKENSAASIKERDERVNAARKGEANAIEKLKAAESKLRVTMANPREASAKMRELRLKKLERPEIQVVTAKEIETFGEKLVQQKVQMPCTFTELSDTWAKELGALTYQPV